MTHGNGVRVTGQIIRLVRDKGFGFIRSTTGTDYFFHRSACPPDAWDTLYVQQPVSFEARDGDKGPRAEAIDLLG